MFTVSVSIIFGLFLLGNLTSYLILLVHKKRRKTSTAFLSSDQFSDLLKTMPEREKYAVEDILRAFSPGDTGGQGVPMRYAPFTEHADTETSSKYVNINREGIRSNGCLLEELDERNSKVIMLGGSTTMGYGVADEDTIPARLQSCIDVTESIKLTVVNAGKQSYFSTLELIDLVKIYQSGARPSLVIFIDGCNDVFHNFPVFRNRSRFSESIENFWGEIDYLYRARKNNNILSSAKKLLLSVCSALPLVELSTKVTSKVKRQMDVADQESGEFWTQGIDTKNVDSDALGVSIADLIYDNWSMAEAISSRYGGNALFVLQPVPYLHLNEKYHLFWRNPVSPALVETFRVCYERVRERMADSPQFIDLSKIFLTAEKYTHIDSHHYSPYGNELIAQAISKEVLKNSRPQPELPSEN
jgi:hypothetical protein